MQWFQALRIEHDPAPLVRKLRRQCLTLDERQVRALEQLADALTQIARGLDAPVTAADVDSDADMWGDS
jgi:hypothetical protein